MGISEIAFDSRNIDDIRVLSGNCRGLKDEEKIYYVKNDIRDMKEHIISLQDTHLTENYIRDTIGIKLIKVKRP